MAQYTNFRYLYAVILLFSLAACGGTEPQQPKTPAEPDTPEVLGPAVTTGAQALMSQLDLLTSKKIGIVANHTSVVEGVHLVDTLLASGQQVMKVFSPEHGFRGDADAGQRVKSSVDPRTGLPIVSLYGKNKKPQADQIADLDVVVFDIQDVGTRFYTYLSTLAYVMEACAEQGKQFIVLDRPNPNGWYVDGPVLQDQYSSFIGLHEIPIVHGMTLGEYAELLNGEKWLKEGIQADLTVVKCEGYTHEMRWAETELEWIAPSPNLATVEAAMMYPALCWFEPTPVSIGRGTDSAFRLIGAPWFDAEPVEASLSELEAQSLSFAPRSLPGKSTSPKYQDKECKGFYFQTAPTNGKNLLLAGISLFQAAHDQYDAYSGGEPFFYKNFERWPGNRAFREGIEANMPASDIYQSWQEEVDAFKAIRSKYLLYP